MRIRQKIPGPLIDVNAKHSREKIFINALAVSPGIAGPAFVAWGHALRGDFAEARDEAAALERDIPGALDDTGLRSVMDAWSAD